MLDMHEVTGSNPVVPTIKRSQLKAAIFFYVFATHLLTKHKAYAIILTIAYRV